MGTSFVVSLLLQFYFNMSSDDPRQFAWIVIITVSFSTLAWLAATFATAPEGKEVLLAFYRRVHPSAALWGPIAREAKDIEPRHDGLYNLLDWIAGCVMVYMTLFGAGKIIFGQIWLGILFLAVAGVAGAIIYWDLNRRGWKSVME